MKNDKTRLTIASVSIFITLLLLSAVVPNGGSRIAGALVLLPAAVLMSLLFGKRITPSIHRRVVLIIMTVTAALCLMLYYLSGLSFGFMYPEFPLTASSFITIIVPIAVIAASSEIIRSIVIAGESRWAQVFGYLLCVVADVMTVSGLARITTLNRLMDVVGLTLLPSFVTNLLFNYLSKRYGRLPNLAYRLITGLYAYVLPIVPKPPDSLLAFAKLVIPILIFVFIDALYERKRRYAKIRTSKLTYVLTAALAVVMMLVVMLISCQFRFGALVIGSESMSGEINKGDTVIYERYDGQRIDVGQVIVFEKDGARVIHRVIEMKRVNGQVRYFTKGDANEHPDTGYITDSDIIGLTNVKIPYVGYPTIWIRDIFKNTSKGD